MIGISIHVPINLFLDHQKSLHVICTNPYNQQRSIQMSALRLTAVIVESGKLQLALS